jgi:rfaE bifunctional protein kinase chain/domain
MRKPTYSRLKSIISKFPKAKVLVVGDLILDEFIWGTVSRISPEAPVPVVWVNSENYMPGGACNVASNIRSLDAEVHVMGAVGTDLRAKLLLQILERKGIGVEGIYRDAHRPTTQKTRIIAHHQQVVRIDREEQSPISSEAHQFFLKQFRQIIPNVDAVCIEDYGKGMITTRLIREITKLSKKCKNIVTVDPKEDHLSFYKGVTAITPNHHEASALSGIKINSDKSLRDAGAKLLRALSCENVLITQGEQGMTLFQKGRKPAKIPTMARDVFDVSGAGDTVVGTYTLSRAMKATPLEAAFLANCAAGIVIGKLGTAVVKGDELTQRVKQMIEVKSWKP